MISPHVKVNAVFREEKKDFCNGKGCILIDDFRKNIEEWENNGGTGILFVNARETKESVLSLIKMFNV